MAHILLSLTDESVLSVVEKALSSTKHTTFRLEGLTVGMKLEKAAELIAEFKAEMVIMDYWEEDLLGVKLMQTVADVADRPVFIFIDSNCEANREEIIMALNEGARAVLPCNFSPAALVNHVEKALAGSWRFRLQAKEMANSAVEKEMAYLQEQLAKFRINAKYYQKLVAHLLANPMTDQAHKVLLVSDSPYQLELLKNILEDYRFVVSTASSATEGLNIVEVEKPRIIVSDLELEDMSGLEFCREVKLVRKIMPCYFVICTASQDKIDMIMTPGNGTDDCLVKPSGQHDTEDFISRVALGLLV